MSDAPSSPPTHPKFPQGVYTVQGDRWFGRGRVLSKEPSSGFTAPLLDLLPGETADVQIDDGLLRNARVLQHTVRDVSPWRMAPPCQNAAFCPGCTLQHVNPEGREDYHRTLIREVLTRYGGFFDLPPIRVHRGLEGDHRMRTRLWLAPVHENAPDASGNEPVLHHSVRWHVGMRRRLVHVGPLVDFSTCIANAPALRYAAQRLRSVPLAQKVWQALPTNARWIECAWDGATLWVDASAWPDDAQKKIVAHLQDAPEHRVPVDVLRADAPWQPVNPPMQQALYDAILQCIDVHDKTVFDLTCADGGLSFALARAGAEVWASDRHWPAVERTQSTAYAQNLYNVHTRGGDAAAVLKGARRRGENVDILVINPMREPVGDDAMTAAHHSGAADLFYLAPAPKAGAKDLAVLKKLGWTIRRSDAFVLHPWTGQSMLFAWMQRSARPPNEEHPARAAVL